jgi:ABC-type multidrug transport system fused ATPase/permease subunit
MWFHDDDGEEAKREISNFVLLAWIIQFLKPHWKLLSIVVVPMILGIYLQLQIPQLLRHIIDHNIMTGTMQDVYVSLAKYITFMLSALVLGYIFQVLLARMGLRIIMTLKRKLLRHVLNLDLKFFGEYTPGTLIARVESDTERLRQLFTEVTFSMLRTLFVVGFVVFYMIRENREVALTILTVVPVLLVLTLIFLRFIRKYYRNVREKYAQVLSFITEYVQGVDVIQLYNYDKRAKERLQERNIAKYRVEKAAAFFEYGFWGFFWTAEIIAIMIALSTGTSRILDGAMTIGTLVMFMEYIRQVFFPLMMFSEQLNFIQRALVSAERVYNIINLESSVKDPVRSEKKPTLEKEIRFENVSFGYEDNNNVLHDVSFKISAGEKVALVGASGGGKSTVVNLLCRFYDPNEGRILADGIDIREFNQKDWRELIGLVLQDVYLFPGSIADNLRVMDPDIPLERVEKAAGIVRADEFIRKMREGYQSELAERGANLSVGERQLLSFARALSFDPPLLILDEATSSVDPYTERLIQEGIDKLLKGRTSLVVAHRLSTILNSDRIIVVDGGRVVEKGTHEELLEKGGLYKHLYELQFSSSIIDEGGEA